MPAQAFVMVAVENRARHQAGDRRARLKIPIDRVKQRDRLKPGGVHSGSVVTGWSVG
jgi:hypothetical protein